MREFLEGKARNLGDDVINARHAKRDCGGFARDVVLEFVEQAALNYSQARHESPSEAQWAHTRRLVFIGYGLRDPDLNYLLEEQNSIYKNFGQRHFAFVADPGKVLAEYFSDRFNIEVLPYKSNRRHLQLQTLLQALVKRVRQEKRARKEVVVQRKIELPLTAIRSIRDIMSYERELCEVFGSKIEALRARFLQTNARKAGFTNVDIELIEKSLEKSDAQPISKQEKGEPDRAAHAFAAFARSNDSPEPTTATASPEAKESMRSLGKVFTGRLYYSASNSQF